MIVVDRAADHGNSASDADGDGDDCNRLRQQATKQAFVKAETTVTHHR